MIFTQQAGRSGSDPWNDMGNLAPYLRWFFANATGLEPGTSRASGCRFARTLNSDRKKTGWLTPVGMCITYGSYWRTDNFPPTSTLVYPFWRITQTFWLSQSDEWARGGFSYNYWKISAVGSVAARDGLQAALLAASLMTVGKCLRFACVGLHSCFEGVINSWWSKGEGWTWYLKCKLWFCSKSIV